MSSENKKYLDEAKSFTFTHSRDCNVQFSTNDCDCEYQKLELWLSQTLDKVREEERKKDDLNIVEHEINCECCNFEKQNN